MTSLLHLVMPFKSIISTLMQSYLLFSPPSNAFLHLPSSSASPAHHKHKPGIPTAQHSTLLWGFLCSAQLALASAGTHCGQGHCATWWAARAAPAACIPPAATSSSFPSHPSGVAAQVLLGQSFLQVPGTITVTATCCCRAQPGSHTLLLLGHLNTHLITSGQPTSTWAPSHWPMVLNPYLNSHFKPESIALPPQERACRCYKLTGHHRCQGVKTTLRYR